MQAVWKERGLPKITEQRKNEWFISLELDETRRRMTAIDEEIEE